MRFVSPRSSNIGSASRASDAARAPTGVTIRALAPADSFEEITTLLHRAYKRQVDMGLRPLAGRQSADVTRRRAQSSECYVALLPVEQDSAGVHGSRSANRERVVGVILLCEHEPDKGPPWFDRPGVVSFSQFAVDPEVQGKGIGRLLLDHVEGRAREMNATELALSMAEPDAELLRFYVRLGFRLVEHWQWPYTNYRSAILSKALGPSPA